MDLCGCQVYSLCMSKSLGHMSWWCRHFLKSVLSLSLSVLFNLFFSVRHKLVIKEEGGGGRLQLCPFLLYVVIGVLFIFCCLFFMLCCLVAK